MKSRKHLIRLDDNYVAMAIDSLDSFHDVSEYDFSFLDKVLPHCTKDQLSHIEKCTKRVDLSSITDKLWMGFFKRDFGGRAMEEMTEKMKSKKERLKWSEVYKAKGEILEEEEREMGLKMKRMYEREDARKLSRQVRVLDNVIIPASSSFNKKSLGLIKKGGVNKGGRKKNPLMSRIKKQYDNSLEKRNLDYTNMKRSQIFNC